MKLMKNFSLNGWWRIYIVVTLLWLIATCVSYYQSLPDFNEDPEQIASHELREYIEGVRKLEDPFRLHQEADHLCEDAYNLSGVNKNACMSYMIASGSGENVSNAIMMVHLIRPMLAKRTQQVKEEILEEKMPQIIDESILHLKIALIVPLVALLLGWSVAWIRRGFQEQSD